MIDLEAIRHNVRQLRGGGLAGQGHGGGQGRRLRPRRDSGGPGGPRAPEPAGWASPTFPRPSTLRAAGIEAPLLAWLHTPDSNFGAAVAAGIDIGCSGWELDRIVAAAREQERPGPHPPEGRHGLGRNGATLDAWDSLVGEAMEYQDQGLLRVVGIFSHLAVADEPERPETDEQLAAFREVLAVAAGRRRGPRSPPPGQHPGHPVPAGHAL